MITIKNLNKYYYKNKPSQIHVINDTSIEFPKHGLVAILGESGSGKTTLMNVIGGLDNFNSGSITIDDYQINKYSSSKMDRIRNEKIGYVFQNYILLNNRTVYYNLLLSLNIYDLSNQEKEKRINYVLDAVGMLRYKKKNISELSGGQQQRVAIARALIKAPSLILADEPTGNLDEKNTIQIMNIIKKISETTLVIMVSHEKSIASSYADVIINVSDGKVVSKIENQGVNYTYKDDQNLYLKDYKKEIINNQLVDIEYYSNTDHKLSIKIIEEKGRYYIVSNEKVIVINENDEIKVKDEHYEMLDIKNEVFSNDYHLDVIPYKKKPRLPFKEIVALACLNLKKMGKRNLFLGFILLLVVVLTLIGVQSIISASKVDYINLTNSDSRIYSVEVKKSELTTDTQFLEDYTNVYKKIKNDNKNIDIILSPSKIGDTFVFSLSDFTQIKNTEYEFSSFTFMQIDKLNEKDLIYGRMPQNASEIVVDRWVIDKTLYNTTAKNFINLYSFINKDIHIKNAEQDYKIVGICESNQKSIYMNKWTIMSIFTSNMKKRETTVCGYSEYIKYANTKQDLTVNQNEIIIRDDAIYEYPTLKLNDDDNLEFNATRKIPFGDCPFYAIVSDDKYEEIMLSVYRQYHEKIDFCCDNEAEKIQLETYLNNFDNEGMKIKLNHYSKYDEVIEPAILESKRLVTSRVVIVATIIIIGIIIVIFTMRSYAIKNIYEIGVYRAIGINKGSIILVYAFEILIISIFTTVLGGLLGYGVTSIISMIPTSQINLIIPFWQCASIIGILVIINIISSIVPIAIYMHLTPSQLLSKYDL